MMAHADWLRNAAHLRRLNEIARLAAGKGPPEMTMEPMTIEEIKEYLPHRYPFLLLDRIVEWRRTSASSRSRT